MEELDRLLRRLDRERAMDRRSFLGLAGALGLTAAGGPLLAACGGGPSSSAAPSPSAPLDVGVLQPLTGTLQAAYKPLFVPLKIAVDEINAAGGIMGRKINLVVADDEGKASSEGTAVRDLIGRDIHYIVGPIGSSQVLASLAATTGQKVIHAPFANDPSAFDVSKYPQSFSLAKTTEQDNKLMLSYAVAKSKRIAILAENTALGQSGTNNAVSVLKAAGVTPLATEFYESGAASQAANVARLKATGAEVLVTYSGNSSDPVKTMIALLQANYQPIYIGSSTTLVNVTQILPPGTTFPADFLKQIRTPVYKTTAWSPGKPVSARVEKYMRKVVADPDSGKIKYATAVDPFYDLMYLLKHVIEGAKSFDVAKVKPALESVKDFDGIIGKLSFSKTDHIAVSDDAVVLGSPASDAPESFGVLPQLAT
jgi:branched-chain amino acid transport system substrate-binding protein